ncbi:hypothetical protein GUITHDRAFT_108659 [Guillardia theta CCMP2712]|uniref:Uncharacterized protein n=1 Tax=Guillardia theta (strain CCMP2712) TaxID=905079 RepID=L1JA48_GUITC|nr:hypothetical protein GUITHDRAFT_108659 [Guillardia theta CCMP2712]EKX45391.1 hypothetical protein GUITHDRAFT_108659 [Guillardia theta CCMP2712]|eukprot:XP_005832371.1 hypothetical protein GUITHDRAFT_108659 [Guillardia theta CCMP2712]
MSASLLCNLRETTDKLIYGLSLPRQAAGMANDSTDVTEIAVLLMQAERMPENLGDVLDDIIFLGQGLQSILALSASRVTCVIERIVQRSSRSPKTSITHAEKERRKALLVAILTRSLQRLEEWMSEFANKPDVNFTVGRDRYTPLMLAAMRGDMEVVRILVEKMKANKHAKTYRGDKSAADLAEDEEIKRYLSAQG